MSELSTLSVHLTKSQYKKFINGKTFQLSSQQLHRPSDKQNHSVDIVIDKHLARKYKKAVRNQGGLRFNPKEMHGGSLKSIMKSVKKVGNKIAKSIEKVKKAVPEGAMKGLVDSAIMAAGTYMGDPHTAMEISKSVNKGIDGLYSHNFSKKLTKHNLHKAIEGTTNAANSYVDSQYGGSLKSIGKQIKNFGKKIENKVIKPAVNGIVKNKNTIVDLAGQTAISALLPAAAQPLANYGLQKGVNAMGGSMLPLGNAVVAGGSMLPLGNAYRGRGLKGSVEMRERMAQVRAHRKA